MSIALLLLAALVLGHGLRRQPPKVRWNQNPEPLYRRVVKARIAEDARLFARISKHTFYA